MKIQQTLWLLLLCCLSLTVQANNPTLKQLVKDADLIIIGKLYNWTLDNADYLLNKPEVTIQHGIPNTQKI